MKNKDIITILFPAFFIVIITIILSLNILKLNDIDLKGALILFLILVFPLLFLSQGIISAVNNVNIFLSLTISVFAFILFVVRCLNNSAYVYILVYSLFGVVGYLVTNWALKIKKSKK